jgi:hypothetical protein
MTSPTEVRRDVVGVTFFGRPGWMLVLHGYFDETGTHGRSPIICVAGYLFEGSRAIDFSARFEALKKRFSVPDTAVFSASDCMGLLEPFDQWSRETADAFVMGWAEAIAVTASLGVVAVVDKQAFDNVFAKKPGLLTRVGSQYTLSVMAAVNLIRLRLDQDDDSRIVDYTFESRTESDPEASSLLAQISGHPELKQRFRYGGHVFTPKNTHLPLYAADLLAWEWQHFIRDDDPSRASLRLMIDAVRHVHDRYGSIKISIQTVVNDFYGLRPFKPVSRRQRRRSRRGTTPSS